jgi:type IV secretion system protein VirB10
MSGPAKEAPETFAVRAKPRPIRRLSRKALAGLLGGAAAVIMGGAIWALRPASKPAAPEELYSTDRPPTAEGLNQLPRDYAGTRLPAGTPRLGPPLPGDLGRPILWAQEGGRLPPDATPQIGPQSSAAAAADQARAERLKAAQAAIASPLFAASYHARAGAANGLGIARTPELASPTQLSAREGNARTPSIHEAFAAATATDPPVSAHRLTAPPSPYTLMAGSVISAALVTGLNSDLPGQVIATVTEPVFDSLTGRTLLIPQGARLLGTYDSQTTFGESRAMLVWTRLILPNGQSIALDRVPAVDEAGFAGLSDRVDPHWRRLIGGAMVSSLLGVGAELASPQTSAEDGQIVIAMRNGVQDTVNQVGQELIRRNLDIKPTITVRPGSPLRVLVAQDLVLEPYSPA